MKLYRLLRVSRRQRVLEWVYSELTSSLENDRSTRREMIHCFVLHAARLIRGFSFVSFALVVAPCVFLFSSLSATSFSSLYPCSRHRQLVFFRRKSYFTAKKIETTIDDVVSKRKQRTGKNQQFYFNSLRSFSSVEHTALHVKSKRDPSILTILLWTSTTNHGANGKFPLLINSFHPSNTRSVDHESFMRPLAVLLFPSSLEIGIENGATDDHRWTQWPDGEQYQQQW